MNDPIILLNNFPEVVSITLLGASAKAYAPAAMASPMER
jgi:hypothetical protein